MNTAPYHLLKTAFELVPQIDYPVHSRIHPLHTINNAFIKRDDELGFGLSGSKARKFRTLIPQLINDGIKNAIIIGSSHSNNVLALSQLLTENRISAHLFLKKTHNFSSHGTLLFTRLINAPQQIHWIASEEWSQVENLAQTYAHTLNASMVIAEGSALPIALLGSLSLPFDILNNESQHKLSFDHIFIDAGTGISAMAVILAFAFLRKATTVHVVLMAGSAETFSHALQNYHVFFQNWLKTSMPFPQNFILHQPLVAKSFGSVNTAIIQEIHDIASQEGILTDPIYSAKLFLTAKNVLKDIPKEKRALLIHSGGALALNGYLSAIENFLTRTHAP